MTVEGAFPTLRAAPRRSSCVASAAYYYGYYSVRAETV
jgi:hypothetical protein